MRFSVSQTSKSCSSAKQFCTNEVQNAALHQMSQGAIAVYLCTCRSGRDDQPPCRNRRARLAFTRCTRSTRVVLATIKPEFTLRIDSLPLARPKPSSVPSGSTDQSGCARYLPSLSSRLRNVEAPQTLHPGAASVVLSLQVHVRQTTRSRLQAATTRTQTDPRTCTSRKLTPASP